MTMIAEHGATVLPFTDALLREPRKRRLARRSRPSASLPTARCPTT